MRSPSPRAITLALALALAVPATARGGSDPAKRWKTIRTAHFRVHYDRAGEAMARRAAALGEEARARVQSLLGLAAVEPVEMVLVDDVDDANGFATVYPYDHLVLLAAPPGPESELGVFDDFLRTLILHEYVHVAHMDAVSGFPAFVNRLLGKTVTPSGAANSWFIEGLATFVETRLTGGGRVGSTAFERILRTAALGGTFLDLSEMTIPPLKWPRGGAAYVYGGSFLDFLYARRGVDGLRAFLRDYGARIVPFAMNTVARRAWGKDFLELYEEFRAGVTARARATADRVRAAGGIEGRRLTRDGEFKSSPVFRPDGKAIWYVRSDGSSEAGVFEHDLASGRERRRWDCRGGCGGLAVADGALFTTHAVPWRLYSSHGDVFRLGPGPGRSERLTRRARARDVAAGPVGSLAFVTAEYDQVSLAIRGPNGTTRTLVPAGRFASMGSPRMLVDGRIAFAGSAAGRWDLWAARPDGTLDRLTDDGCIDRDPVPTPDGRWLLYTSDPGGIDDILAMDLVSGERRRVTRVVGGAGEPDVSPDGSVVVFTTYSARGYDLATLPFDPAELVPLGPDDSCRATLAAPEPVPAAGPAGTYWAWPSIRPRALHLSFSAASTGDVRVGAEIGGGDAIGHHAFSLGFDVDPRRPDPTAWGSYSYDGWWAGLGLDLATWHSAATAIVDERHVPADRRAWLANVSTSIPVPLRNLGLSFGLGYSVRWVTGTPHPRGTDPATSPPWLPSETVIGGLTLSTTLDWTRTFARSIGPSQGLHLGASMGLRHPIPAAGGWAMSFGGHAFGYLPLPWRGDQVLAVLASGASAFGDRGWRDVYATGGFPPQDLFSSIVNREPLQGRYLRGFAQGAFVGDAYTMVNAEFRAPLWYIHRGLGTFPIAARRLWATAFTDWGGAWWRKQDPTFGLDAGFELALSTNLFLLMDATFRLGYAHGFGPRGRDVIYFLLTP